MNKQYSTILLALFWLIQAGLFAQPAAPQLIAPENNAQDVPTSITFRWSGVSDADIYQIQVAIDQSFSAIIYDETTPGTSIELSGFPRNSTFFWRVRAGTISLLIVTEYGDWSGVWNFTTIPPSPNTPLLVSPDDGATGIATNPTLAWNATERADTYRAQLATDSGFNTLVVDSSGITATDLQLSGLDHNTEYYWRVQASNGGGQSDWSAIRNFTTVIQPPASPTLVSPDDGATGIATNPTLAWNAAERADTYQVQLATDSGFSSLVVDTSGLSATNFQVNGLDNGTEYFWRVRASNTGGKSDWSATRDFTTAVQPPAPPALVSPENGATDVSTTPLLDWEPSERAESYDFQIAADNTFQSIVVDLEDVTSTQYKAGLEGYMQYFWRVRAANSQGASEWSDEWSFTTENTGNSITVLSPDAQSFWKAGNTYTLRWKASNQVNNIRIEYSVDGGETWNLVTDQITPDETGYGWKVPAIGSIQTQIKISGQNDPGIFDISESFVTYPSAFTLKHSFKFPSSASATDYRLIGLPANSNIPIQQLLPGEHGKDWNAYYDNGNPENYLIEFDGSGQFSFSQGRGFWIISRNDFEVEQETPSVTLDADTTFSIALNNGWNIITNPYNTSLPWQHVQAANNIADPIWTYQGSFSQSDVFELYKGYYFFNRDSLAELTIPYPAGISSAPATSTKIVHTAPKLLELSILADGKQYSKVRIGLDPGIKNERGRTYQFAPPAPFQPFRLAIVSKATGGYEGYPLAALHLSQIDRVEQLLLKVKAVPGRQVQLRVNGQDLFNAYALKLVDQQTGKYWDLHRAGPAYLNPEHEYTQYQLLIGYPGAVEKKAGQILPTRANLVQNYPNPFNPRTMIRFSIPEAANVELKVYDVSGRLIQTLVNERLDANFYEIPFNGSNLASGVYLYRLKIGQWVETKKMVLVK